MPAKGHKKWGENAKRTPMTLPADLIEFIDDELVDGESRNEWIVKKLRQVMAGELDVQGESSKVDMAELGGFMADLYPEPIDVGMQVEVGED
jgi:hypothetical protein